MTIPRLRFERTALLVVDLQDKLVPIVQKPAAIVAQSARLIRGFAALGRPIMVTEQYPRRLGPTVPLIAEALPAGTPVESKMKFSACVEDVRRWLENVRCDSVVICGIESHVCVLQTALDLMNLGWMTAVAVDAVSSRRATDHEVAMQRLMLAGAVPVTVEMAILEMVHEAGTDRFKSVLGLLKERVEE